MAAKDCDVDDIPILEEVYISAKGKRRILIAACAIALINVSILIAIVLFQKIGTNHTTDVDATKEAAPQKYSRSENTDSLSSSRAVGPSSDPETAVTAFTMFAIGDWGSTPGKVSGSNNAAGSCCHLNNGIPKDNEPRFKVDFWAQRHVASLMGQAAAQLNPVRIIGHGDNFYWNGVVGSDWKSRFDETFENVYTHPSLKSVKWVNVMGNHDYGGGGWLCGAENIVMKAGSFGEECQSADELVKNLELRFRYQKEYVSPNNRWLLTDHYYVDSVTKNGVTVDIFNVDTNFADGNRICCQCYAYSNKLGIDSSQCQSAKKGEPRCAGGRADLFDACMDKLSEWANDGYNKAMQDTKASTADFKIINSHYSPQNHMTVPDMKKWFELTKTTNVQLWLNGHTHGFGHDISSWGTHFIENGGGGGMFTSSGNRCDKDGVKTNWVASGEPYGFFELSFSKEWLKAQFVSFDHSWQFKGNDLTNTIPGGIARGHCWFIPKSNYTGAIGQECKSSMSGHIGAP